ncbi:MAG: hypothetical protein ACKVOY_04020 [Burkholderiaceae bacterium]|jgi:hypothetical protein
MKYMQINLENFGGNYVEFPLSYIEQKNRVQEAFKFRTVDSEKFEKELKLSGKIVQNNIAYFPSKEFCEGPRWDDFREAVVDMMCKLQAMSFHEHCILEE